MSRFNVDFSDEAAAVLEELARRQNTTKAEVLRRAINLEKWFADTTADGGKVLVEKDGQTREIVKL
jgi:predicted transcriptional regulator